jgi:hypothetical protein
MMRIDANHGAVIPQVNTDFPSSGILFVGTHNPSVEGSIPSGPTTLVQIGAAQPEVGQPGYSADDCLKVHDRGPGYVCSFFSLDGMNRERHRRHAVARATLHRKSYEMTALVRDPSRHRPGN